MNKGFRRFKTSLFVFSFTLMMMSTPIYANNWDFSETENVKNSAYEHMGFMTDEQKQLADKLFIVDYKGSEYKEDINFQFTDLGQQMADAMGLTNDNRSDISKFLNGITNVTQLTTKINEANSIRTQITTLLNSGTSSTSKTDTQVIQNGDGTFSLVSISTGKNVSGIDQNKLNQLIKQYEKATNIPFSSGNILDLLEFDASGSGNKIDFEFKPSYKNFKYLEKVVFTIKRVDGSGSVSAILPLSQQLNVQKNSSISSKYKSITGQSFPAAQISGNTVTYDFSTPIFSKGGSVHDTIRDKWAGTTSYTPALGIKVNNNGLYEVTAKVYGGTYIEESKEMNANIVVKTNVPKLSTKPKKPSALASSSEKKKYQTALSKWNNEKKLYDKWYNKELGSLNNTTSQNTDVAKQYYKDFKLSENNYKFTMKFLNNGSWENKSLLLSTRKYTSEYWPYKETFEMKSVGSKYPKVKITSSFIAENGFVGPMKSYANSLPTYVSKKTNKVPDATRTNQLLASYTWKVGVTNKEIIVPTTAQNAEIGGALTK